MVAVICSVIVPGAMRCHMENVTVGARTAHRPISAAFFGVVLLAGCGSTQPLAVAPNTMPDRPAPKIRKAAFIVSQEVFNSELMAPYDVFHHTYFRDKSDYIAPFIVAASTQPIVSFEGIAILPHYSFENAPPADIVVLPSTNGSMDRDLKDEAFMRYVEKAVAAADWVITVCDGAFVLAETGALDGRVATTFPADRAALQKRYPQIDVRHDVRLVIDGKYITSVGGGLSYEPALYLVEHLWSTDRVKKNARGLVWPWNLASIPHLIVGR